MQGTGRRRRALRLGLLAAAFGMLPAAPAWAHASLLSSSPTDSTVVAAAPGEVSLRYDEPISMALGSLKVLAPDGSRVDTGSARLRDDGRTVAVSLQSTLPHGTYTVLWRIMSADSHTVSGAETFSVVQPSPSAAGTAAAAAGQTGAGAAAEDLLSASRLLLYAGLVLLLGGLCFLLGLWPAGLTSPPARRLVWSGWALMAVATAAGLLLQGPYAAGQPLSSALDPALLRDVLPTPYGVAALARLALLVGAALLLRRLPSGRSLALVGLAAGLGLGLLLTISAVGHAATGDLAPVSLVADTLHLAAMSLWTGGLVLLAGVLLRHRPTELAAVLPRWSRYAANAVAVLVLTGTFAAWREVREIGALTGTPYGHLLLVKTGLVVLMLGLGAAGRSLVRRHLTASAVGATDLPTAMEVLRKARLLRRGVLLEAGTALVVLGITSVLVSTNPAQVDYAPVFDQSAAVTGSLRVQVGVAPARLGLNDLQLSYTSADGGAVDLPEVTARWTRLGSADVVPVVLFRSSPGHYERLRVVLPSIGAWTLTVSSRTSDIDDRTNVFAVRIR